MPMHSFEAVIGDRKVVTQTKRKAEAEQEFSHAVQQGHTAVLAKQVRLPCSTATSRRVSELSVVVSCRIATIWQ